MDSNKIIELEKQFVDNLCDDYQYDSNIRHLLYLIVPAFIIKYGMHREKIIHNTLKDVKIYKNNQKSKTIKGYYIARPIKVGNDINIIKHLVLYNYDSISLIDLLDTLVHELNHAINSYKNDIRITNKYICLRTGLTHLIYDKNTLESIKKDDSYILEEIINTKQTDDVINIIKNFDKNNNLISSTIFSINGETKDTYTSDSYLLETYICKEITENRTFIRTLENLRLSGEIYNVRSWFDDIYGKKGTFKEMIQLLIQIIELEKTLSNKVLFKKPIINKIRSYSRRVMNIINKFNENSNFV